MPTAFDIKVADRHLLIPNYYAYYKYPASLIAYHEMHGKKANFCNSPHIPLGAKFGRGIVFVFASSPEHELLISRPSSVANFFALNDFYCKMDGQILK